METKCFCLQKEGVKLVGLELHSQIQWQGLFEHDVWDIYHDI